MRVGSVREHTRGMAEPPKTPPIRNDKTPTTIAPVRIDHAVQGRDLDLTEYAAWWTARRADIDARGGPAREPPVADIRKQFERFVYRGGAV